MKNLIKSIIKTILPVIAFAAGIVSTAYAINYYQETRSPDALISFESPKPLEIEQPTASEILQPEKRKLTFYKELGEMEVVVGDEPITPPQFVEDPILVIRGEVKPLEGDLRCLAVNMYFEGRNRSEEFRIATAWSVLNRVGVYGNKNICDVVKNSRRDVTSGLIYKHKCHYSWYCDGRETLQVAENEIEDKAYQRAVQLSLMVLEQKRTGKKGYDITHGATHYHRDDKSPGWANHMAYLTKIDDHVFYIGH